MQVKLGKFLNFNKKKILLEIYACNRGYAPVESKSKIIAVETKKYKTPYAEIYTVLEKALKEDDIREEVGFEGTDEEILYRYISMKIPKCNIKNAREIKAMLRFAKGRLINDYKGNIVSMYGDLIVTREYIAKTYHSLVGKSAYKGLDGNIVEFNSLVSKFLDFKHRDIVNMYKFSRKRANSESRGENTASLRGTICYLFLIFMKDSSNNIDKYGELSSLIKHTDVQHREEGAYLTEKREDLTDREYEINEKKILDNINVFNKSFLYRNTVRGKHNSRVLGNIIEIVREIKLNSLISKINTQPILKSKNVQFCTYKSGTGIEANRKERLVTVMKTVEVILTQMKLVNVENIDILFGKLRSQSMKIDNILKSDGTAIYKKNTKEDYAISRKVIRGVISVLVLERYLKSKGISLLDVDTSKMKCEISNMANLLDPYNYTFSKSYITGGNVEVALPDYRSIIIELREKKKREQKLKSIKGNMLKDIISRNTYEPIEYIKREALCKLRRDDMYEDKISLCRDFYLGTDKGDLYDVFHLLRTLWITTTGNEISFIGLDASANRIFKGDNIRERLEEISEEEGKEAIKEINEKGLFENLEGDVVKLIRGLLVVTNTLRKGELVELSEVIKTGMDTSMNIVSNKELNHVGDILDPREDRFKGAKFILCNLMAEMIIGMITEIVNRSISMKELNMVEHYGIVNNVLSYCDSIIKGKRVSFQVLVNKLLVKENVYYFPKYTEGMFIGREQVMFKNLLYDFVGGENINKFNILPTSYKKMIGEMVDSRIKSKANKISLIVSEFKEYSAILNKDFMFEELANIKDTKIYRYIEENSEGIQGIIESASERYGVYTRQQMSKLINNYNLYKQINTDDKFTINPNTGLVYYEGRPLIHYHRSTSCKAITNLGLEVHLKFSTEGKLLNEFLKIVDVKDSDEVAPVTKSKLEKYEKQI